MAKAMVDESSPHETRDLDLSRKDRDNRRSSRIKTAYRSLRVLKRLKPGQVDAFIASYIIYSLDWNDEKTMLETLGPNYQQHVGECLSDYYSVLNHLCAIGDLEKMYIPPAMDLGESIVMNQILYEESIAKELCLPPHAKVLDLGCGRGRVAAHLARITGASVVGVNIDEDQVRSARDFNCELRNDFIRHDFNDLPLPLPSDHFDGFYQIQAFSLAKDHTKLLQEVYRVLKPGARVSMLDWASLEAYDPQNPKHEQLMQKIKPLIGAVGTPTPKSMQNALITAGFRIIRMNNASIDGLQAPLIERVDGFFRTTKKAILGFVRVGLLPAHFKTLFERLTQDCDAFVEADRARLITTSYHWLAEKPPLVNTKLSPGASKPGSISVSPSSSQRTLRDSVRLEVDRNL